MLDNSAAASPSFPDPAHHDPGTRPGGATDTAALVMIPPGTTSKSASGIAALVPILLMPVIAAFSVFSVQTYLGLGVRLLPLTMVAALALIIYALNGLSDRAEDGHNNPQLAAAATRYSIPVLVISSAALCSSALLLANQGRLHPGYGIVLVAGIIYSFRLVPWPGRGGKALTWVRLKDLLLVKNLTIGATWASAVFLLPLIDGNSTAGSAILSSIPFWFLMVSYGLAVTINSIFCDMDDRPGDAVAGVVTLAVRLGNEKCGQLVWAAAGLWTILLALSHLGPGWLDFDHFTFLACFTLAYPLLVIGGSRAGYLPPRARRYAIESSDLLFAFGLLLLSV